MPGENELELSSGATVRSFRADLSRMKLSVLRKRAIADGVDETAMDEAADGAREKDDLVELILAMDRKDRPHTFTLEPAVKQPQADPIGAMMQRVCPQLEASAIRVREVRREDGRSGMLRRTRTHTLRVVGKIHLQPIFNLQTHSQFQSSSISMMPELCDL